MQRELQIAGKLWLIGGAAMVAIWVSLFAFPGATEWWTDRDYWVLERFVDARSSGVTSLADGVALLGSSWFLRVLRIGTIIALCDLIEDTTPGVYYRGNWYFTFEGGCITYQFDTNRILAETVATDAENTLGFYPAGELRQGATNAGFDIG